MGIIAKAMKYELRYIEGFNDFHTMQENLWMLQKQTREILNKTIQILYNWDYNSKEQFRKTGIYPNVLENTGYKSLDGYIYDCLKPYYTDIKPDCMNAAIQKAYKKYKSSELDILKGTMSLPSYKNDQPILIPKKHVKIFIQNSTHIVTLKIFSESFIKSQGISHLTFSIKPRDNTQKSILANILNGEYSFGECQLVYENKKWFLILTYKFQAKKHSLDENKILGVDLGEKYAIYASSVCSKDTFKIEGGVITDYARKLENRKRSLQEQAKYCGDGRIGHGIKTRVADVYTQGNRIANYRDTINHRFSKALIEYALKGGYGTIQMEDLTGIKSDNDFPKRLQHWTNYDLCNVLYG